MLSLLHDVDDGPIRVAAAGRFRVAKAFETSCEDDETEKSDDESGLLLLLLLFLVLYSGRIFLGGDSSWLVAVAMALADVDAVAAFGTDLDDDGGGTGGGGGLMLAAVIIDLFLFWPMFESDVDDLVVEKSIGGGFVVVVVVAIGITAFCR